MVWQRIVQHISKRFQGKHSSVQHGNRRSRARKMRVETLTKRELLVANLATISGVSFADLTGDGLTGDDTRLDNLSVELFLDNGDNTFDAGVDTSQGTTTTNALGEYSFRGLAVGTYFVVQADPGAGFVGPDPVLTTVPNENGVLLQSIDEFTQTLQVVRTGPADGNDNSSSSAAPEALGGFRDLRLQQTNAAGSLDVTVAPVTSDLSIGSSGGIGTLTIQYDGNDNSTTLDPIGLRNGGATGVSLTGDAPGSPLDPDAGLLLMATYQDAGDDITVRIFTDATNFATATVAVPQAAVTNEIFLRYDTDFNITGAVDFSDIGAIEFEIEISEDNDGEVAAFLSQGPNIITSNLSNTPLLTLGGTVFNDFSPAGGGTNDGVSNNGETGIAGVEVLLFEDDGSLDPATDTPVGTTTTDQNGDYQFTDLMANDYLVVIPDAEFAMGEPLFGFATSTGNSNNDPAIGPDPNDDVDGDDNGRLVAGVGLTSGLVTLAAGTEPTNDGDTDANTNFSVDFGVAPQVDLQIEKLVDAANTSAIAGGTAVFDLTITNNGPADATGVTFTDVIPAGLTFDAANSNFGGLTNNFDNGTNTLTVEIGALAANTNITIEVATTIDNNVTADITNTGSVAGNEVETDPSNNTDDAIVDISNADLVITKDDNTTTDVPAGTEMTYTITVRNDGPDGATSVVATDTLPNSVSFVSAVFTTGAGTVTENNGVLTIDIGDLALDETEVIDVTVLVDPDSPTPILNEATVIATPNNDPDEANNTTSVETPIVRNVDVGVDKTVSANVIAGGDLTYTFVVTNDGPGVARDVVVTDTLNAALTFNSFDALTSGVTIAQNGQDLTFTVGTMAVNETRTFTIDAGVASNAFAEIPNTAVVTTSDNDINAANDQDTVNVTPGRETDLVLTKTVDLATAVPGQDQLVYTFVISHDTDSISDAINVTFTDTLPAGVTGAVINSADATTQNFDSASQTVTMTFASIPVGETRTFTITTDVDEDATGTVTNTGNVSIAQAELDTTNNSDSASTDLTPQFDVTITKTADDTTPAPGANVTYTVGLTNSGPSTATGVILTDDIPAGLTFVSGTLNGQAATSDGTTVTFPAITLADDATANATLVFTVGVDASGTITNTATVAADNGETNTNNNTATEDITATPTADLIVTKTVDETNALAGSNLVYTVTVTNQGVSTAVDATATDTLPSGVTFVSGLGPNNEALTVNNGVVTVNGGNLAPNGSFSFTINATINAGVTADQVNNVAVSTTTNESNTGNNSASATTTIDPATASVSGFVYVDTDNDGVRDANEVGIPNVALALTGTDAFGNPVSLQATTDSNGQYIFSGLAQGTSYRIDQTQPAGFRDGQETAGTGATATVVDDAFTELGLAQAANATDFNFGERLEALSKRRFLASST